MLFKTNSNVDVNNNTNTNNSNMTKTKMTKQEKLMMRKSKLSNNNNQLASNSDVVIAAAGCTLNANNNNARREKSLSLLCQKFLSFYPKNVSPNERIIISLDSMAQILEVERRRIYDIVNVLESVEILSRFCKNQYIWHGFSQIPHTLSKLKTLAVKSSFLDYTKALMHSQLEQTIDLHEDSKQAVNVCFEISNKINMLSSTCNEKITSYNNKVNNLNDSRDASTQTISISREEKSLGIMSQKFLMLFLTSEDGLVSINFAARVLLGDTKNDVTEQGRFKTKIRRLYDIANVLSSIGLIKKYHYSDVSISKPAYKYIGPCVDVIRNAEYVFDFMNCGNPSSNSKHSLFDHFKRNLNLECNIPKFDVNTGILTSKLKTNNQTKPNSSTQPDSTTASSSSLFKLIIEKQEVSSPPPQMIQPNQIQPQYPHFSSTSTCAYADQYQQCNCEQQQACTAFATYYNNNNNYNLAPNVCSSTSSTYYHFDTMNNFYLDSANNQINGHYFANYQSSDSASSLNSNSSMSTSLVNSNYFTSINHQSNSANMTSNSTPIVLPGFSTFLN